MQYKNNKGLLVIEMITYNHEKYIAKAIESVLTQKTNFDFKLIICEDCSADNTARICTAYKNKYPDKIDLHLNEKNVGIYLNARKLHELSFNSNARYIAMLDGDDYWTDENKLQKQVDFLEKNPDYAFCFHRVYEKHKNGKIQLSTLNKEKEETTFTIEDLSRGNFIHTPSVVFRNGLFELPNGIWDAHAGDYVIHMLNARKGLIKFLPDIMAVYRRHGKGLWSALNNIESGKKWNKVLDLLLTFEFPPHVLSLLKKQQIKSMKFYLLSLLLENQYEKFSLELENYLTRNPEEKDAWLYKYFPELFGQILESRTYKAGRKISIWAKKLKFIPT